MNHSIAPNHYLVGCVGKPQIQLDEIQSLAFYLILFPNSIYENVGQRIIIKIGGSKAEPIFPAIVVSQGCIESMGLYMMLGQSHSLCCPLTIEFVNVLVDFLSQLLVSLTSYVQHAIDASFHCKCSLVT